MAVAVVTVVIVAEVAGFAYRQHQIGHQPSTVIAASGPSPSTSTSATTNASNSTAVSPGSASTSTSLADSPPTTSIVTAPGIVHYSLPASAKVQLTFTGTTWLEARSSPTGTVLYVGTLSAGATQAFQTPVWIRFGNSVAAKATVNGAALQIPAGLGDLEVTAG